MPPRIIRPRHDRAHWIAACGCGLGALMLGYVGGARVFNPGRAAATDDTEAPADLAAQESAPAAGADADVRGNGASAGNSDASVQPTVAPEPAASEPRVPVRVVRSVLQSCGDGEELTLLGARCENVPGLDQALRQHLDQLGTCPAAEAAAATPEAVLSIGLRVDFARRRVTALPGHSSSVRNPLTFVPCARSALEHATDLWRMQPAHPRYLYFFSVHFGPLAPGEPPRATPTPIATHVSTGTPGAPAPSVTPSDTTPPRASHDALPTSVTVEWSHAIVRDAPRSGAVVARVARGTVLSVVGRSGSWWHVQWAGQTGWVFSQAIGQH